MKTKESIFQVGDKVYDYLFGWGEVKCINSGLNYPIRVQSVDYSNIYTDEGFLTKSDKYPTLSFTEYNLTNGGFSQVRPQPTIEKDTVIYVRNAGGSWEMRYFSHFTTDGYVVCFEHQKKSTETGRVLLWEEYSLTNPLI